ncbi:MAG: RDD family protein, partial [Gammaproteobacteria bacterium]|nr:RDD family protein [Gammaproteobacteria bacterium]
APVTMLVTFVFFGWFWTHGGQTLGMRAWRLQLTGNRQHAVSWPQSIIRLAIMLLTLGAGTLWVLFNREGKSLQDMAASTVMHRIQKPVTA